MKYKVSVVTPFHNVDMQMFGKCAESVRRQSIGFGNIEWIIVLHNCEAGYLESVSSMFSGCDNVLVRELKNDARTPSSPRNYGTSLASGLYVGYLDGDDSYTPDCLEVAVREAVDTKSQIVWFRREVEKERPDLAPPTVSSLWDNTQKRIVVEQGSWDDAKMFSGFFGFATSYLYNLEFLRSNNLSFSDEMLFGEDFLFVVETCAKAQRICYLPQHIGYHYFVNAGSLVQNADKSSEELVNYAEGFRDLFRIMRSYGIDTQEIAQVMCGRNIARFTLGSPRLTVEDRRRIKEILGPDVCAMHLLPPNKFFDAAKRDMLLGMSRDVILNPENPGETVLRMVLDGAGDMMSILRQNEETDIGRRYNFKGINSFEAFQYRIPITDADYYRPLIRLQTNVGEKNIFVQEAIDRYYKTSGGNLVPSTRSHSGKYAECFASLLKGRKNLLVARSYPILGVTNDNAEIDTLHSAIVKDYFSMFFYVGGIRQASLSSNLMTYISQGRVEDDDYRDIMKDALLEPSLEQIVGLDTEQLLKAFRSLENDWQKMLAELPESGRREEVRRILSEGFDVPVARRLWPHLERIIAFGAGQMYESCNALKRYTGGIPHNHGYYFTEETIFGKAVGDDSNLFECIRNYNVYELMPANSLGENVKPLLWSSAKVGEAYFIVVTGHSGLYRYLTDHVVCPREISPGSIKFTLY